MRHRKNSAAHSESRLHIRGHINPDIRSHTNADIRSHMNAHIQNHVHAHIQKCTKNVLTTIQFQVYSKLHIMVISLTKPISIPSDSLGAPTWHHAVDLENQHGPKKPKKSQGNIPYQVGIPISASLRRPSTRWPFYPEIQKFPTMLRKSSKKYFPVQNCPNLAPYCRS